MSACSTTERTVAKPEVIKLKIPESLLRPCPGKQRGPLPTTQAIVDRLVYTEGALDQCAAQLGKVRDWNSRQ